MEENKNKKITRSNALLIEEVIRSQAKKIRETKKAENQVINVIYEDEKLGYLNCIVEPNGLMSVIYLPFYNVNDSEISIDISKIHEICNRANNILSPSKLAITTKGKVFCATTMPINISILKRTEIIDLMSSIKSGTRKLIAEFAERIKELEKESKED